MVEIIKSNLTNSYGDTIYYLVIDDDLWMSNHDDEVIDLDRALKHAKGNCLILGMGLGLVLSKIWKSSSVNAVTVMENNLDVIAKAKKHVLVENWVTSEQMDKTTIIYENATNITTRIANQFDYVYIDTYIEPDDKAISDIKKIKNSLKEQNLLKPDCVIDGWLWERLGNK